MVISDLRADFDEDDRLRFSFRLDGRKVWTFAQERPNLLEEAGVAVFYPPLEEGEGIELSRPDAAPTFFPGATRAPELVALMRTILRACATEPVPTGPLPLEASE